MKKEEIEDAITDIDEEYLTKALDYKPAKRTGKKIGKKLLILVAATIALNGLVGYNTGYSLRHYVGKNWAMLQLQVDKNGNMLSSSSMVYDLDSESPYEVEDGQIYFTYDGSDRNITEFCSVYDCFLHVDVNFWGNGLYIVIGGTPDNVGYRLGYVIGGKETSSITIASSFLGNDFAPRMDEHQDSRFYGLARYTLNHFWMGALDYEKWSTKFDNDGISPEQRAEFELVNKPDFDYVITRG